MTMGASTVFHVPNALEDITTPPDEKGEVRLVKDLVTAIVADKCSRSSTSFGTLLQYLRSGFQALQQLISS